jgi:hypothetical protein
MIWSLDAALAARLTSLWRQLDLNRARLRLAFCENAYHYGDVRPDPGFRTRR